MLLRTVENILGALESQAWLKMASEFLAHRIFLQETNKKTPQQ